MKKYTSAGLAVIGLLFSILMCTVMLFAAAQSIKDLIHDQQSKRWPTTSGQIVSSSIESFQESGDEYHDPQVKYEYTVAEDLYTSKRIRFGDFTPQLPGRNSLRESIRIVLQYKPGDIVPVFYNANDPSLSVLQPGVGMVRILLMLAIWFLVLFGWFMVAWFSVRRFITVIRS